MINELKNTHIPCVSMKSHALKVWLMSKWGLAQSDWDVGFCNSRTLHISADFSHYWHPGAKLVWILENNPNPICPKYGSLQNRRKVQYSTFNGIMCWRGTFLAMRNFSMKLPHMHKPTASVTTSRAFPCGDYPSLCGLQNGILASDSLSSPIFTLKNDSSQLWRSHYTRI